MPRTTSLVAGTFPRRGGRAFAYTLAALVAACAMGTESREAPRPEPFAPSIATFSIVAHDPDTGDLGVAVQSKFFGVGSVVPWARAGVGAVATQASANTTYGPRGLELLASGQTAGQALAALTEADEQAAQRQLAVIDAAGTAATFTGEACLPWAGDRVGEHYSVQGNLLAGPAVLDAMAAAFETTRGDLATRMTSALAAGQAAGGDLRGRQSAALLVVRDNGGYQNLNDRYIDLRVEDHPAPIRELRRLVRMRHGQLALEQASQLLDEGDARRAADAARRATLLYPDSGSSWILLAAAHLQLGDERAAGEAASEALLRDPWLKSALLRGMVPDHTLEALLADAAFARLWQAIPAVR